MDNLIKSTLAQKLGRRSFVAGTAALFTTGMMASEAAAAAKVIRISTPGTDSEWQSKALVAFKDALEKSMPGAFDVQIHYNGTLFAQGTEIEAMQRGNLEVALTSPADIAELIPEYSIFTTGYLIRDPAHLDAIYDGDIGKEYKAKVAADLGLEILRSQYLGTRHVILREPRTVNVPADLAGVKLRMPGSKAWQFLGNALGANATPWPSKRFTSRCRQARSMALKTLYRTQSLPSSMRSPNKSFSPDIRWQTSSSRLQSHSGIRSAMKSEPQFSLPKMQPRS